MSLTNRYTAIDKAIITSTGNSLIVCGSTTELNNNTSSMIKTDGTTTRDWTLAGSTAALSMLSSSTVLYAELSWYSTVKSNVSGAPDLQSIQDDAITFTTPSGTFSITPTITESLTSTSGTIDRFRSADVTSYVSTGLSGNYTVANVPTSIPSTGLSNSRAGWCLSVVYRNASFEPNKVIYSSGIVNATSAAPLQTIVTGFSTPTSDVGLNARLFLACANGQPLDGSEVVQVGPSFASLTTQGNPVSMPNPNPGTAPNNPNNSFFTGQVNVCNPLSASVGLINLTGTNASNNNDGFVPTQVVGARNKWDLTNLNISSTLIPNQNQLAIQITEGAAVDGVMILGVGSQVKAAAPNITTTFNAFDPDGHVSTVAEVGEPLVYKLQIRNTGTVNATNVIVSSVLDSNVSFIPNTFTVNGSVVAGANVVTGVNIGTVAAGGVANVYFEVLINSVPSNSGRLINASMNYQYSFISGSGSPTTTNTGSTNTVQIDVINPNVTMTKSASSTSAVVGDVITYTCVVTNVGSQDAGNTFFQDKISPYATFVDGSVTIDGVAQPTFNPNTGFTLGFMSGGQNTQKTVTFQTTITSVPPAKQIYNSTEFTFTYTTYHPTPLYSKTIMSNVVTVNILYSSIVGERCINNDYPQVGDTLTYTLSLTNIGNAPATNVQVQEPAVYGATFVTGSVTVGGVNEPTYNPFTGFTIPTIAAGATVDVTYQVLVNTVDPNRLVQNIANVPFQYQISPTSPVVTDDKTSNIVKTLTSFVNVSLVETVDKAYAIIGDILYYSVNVTNTGNIDAIDTIFQSTIQSQSTFVAGSVAIDGIPQPSANPNTGFSIGTLCAGDTMLVTYQATVNSVPISNIIYNNSNLTYGYKIDPTGSTTTATATSNTVQTTITQVNFTFTKAVDKAYAQVGDALAYTMEITNTGNIPLTNVTFYDYLPSSLTFITGQVYVNGVNQPTYNPYTGFSLITIHPGDNVRVSIGATVNSVPDAGYIVNSADFVYTYQLNPTSEVITQTATSNQVRTYVVDGRVTITKAVDKSVAKVGDVLNYSFNISNVGNVNAINLSFIDLVPTGATFVAGSVLVNGVSQPTYNPNTGFALIDLAAGQVVTVAFNATVTSVPTPNTIINTGSVTFSYVLAPNTPPLTSTVTSNQVVTTVNTHSSTLTKAVDKAYAVINDILNYSLVLTNTGTVTLTSVNFQDTIPTGATFQTGTVKIDGTTFASYNPNTGFALSNITAGSSVTIQFQAKVTSVPNPNTIINNGTATYNYQLTPTSPVVSTSVTSNNVTTVVNQATVSLVKSVNKVYATVGDELTYTSVFSNNGTVTFVNNVFFDAVPTNTSFVAGSVTVDGVSYPSYNPNNKFPVPDLAPGNSITVVFKVTVTGLPASGLINNTSRIEFKYRTSPTSPLISGATTSPNVTTYIRVGTMTITKAANRQYAVVGAIVNYSFVIKNTGNTTLTNEIFQDTIQSESTFNAGSVLINGVAASEANPNTGFALPDLPTGQSTTVSFTVTVNSIPSPNGELKNTATVNFQYKIDPAGPSSSGTATSNETIVLIRDTIINPTKAVSPVGTASVGDELTYSFTIANVGNVSATNMVFTDALVQYLTFVSGSVIVNGSEQSSYNPVQGFPIPNIAGGASATVSFRVTINSRPPTNIVTNFATVAYQYQPDPQQPAISATMDTNIVETPVAYASISVVKAVDLEYATIGDQLEYSVVVTNTGSVNVTSLSFEDLVPLGSQFNSGSVIINGVAAPTVDPNNGFSIPNLIPGQANTVTFKTTVTAVPQSGQLDNFATITYNYQLTPSSPVVTDTQDSNTVTTFVKLTTLSITKAVNKAYATLQEQLLYSFSITNTGNATASNLFFQDFLSAGGTFDVQSTVVNGVHQPTLNPITGFSLPDLAPGQTTTILFFAIVTSIPNPNIIENYGIVNGTFKVDPAGQNYPVSATSNIVQTIINIGSLALTKSVNLAYATINDVIIYTVNVLNTGTVDATNVNFRDIIPTGLTFIPDSVKIDGVAQPGLNPFSSFTLGTIAPGGDKIIEFKSTVTSVPNPSLITNTATATFTYRINPSGPDTTTETTSNAVTTQINIGQLNITKAVNKAYATIGDVITYSFSITNTGNVTATNVAFMDTLAEGIAFNGGSVIVNGTSQPTYDPNTGFTIGTINAQGTATVSFTVTVTSIPATNSVLNYAMLTFNYKIDPNGQTYSGTATSNTVLTLLRRATLSAVKSVNKAYATLQEQILYTIVVTNTGNTQAYNLNFVDILSSGGTFDTNSVVVGGIHQPTYNPITGFPLPNLDSGQNVVIQFFAIITSVPTPPIVENYATVTGNYKVDPTGPDYPVSTQSNTVQTAVNVGNLSIVKAVDKQYAKVLDTITYSSVITNTGTVDATNVTFLDTLQAQLSFVSGTVRINGVVNPALNPTTGFNLGTLAPTQAVTVEFDAVINTLPTPPQVLNDSQATFEYKIDPNDSSFTSTKTSNTVTTLIVVGNLTPVKSVDKSIATINEVLNYTITITNTGNTLASEVLFQDTPSTGATFNTGSVIVNGTPQPTYNPTTGFSLGDIAVGAVVTVQFAATVTSIPPTNQITNQATINFKYVVDPKDPPVTTTTTSNTVTTNVAVGNLSVVKSVNKAYATIGDELTYTVVVTNIGNINATNVQFLDATPANSALVLGSVIVNGTPQPTYNPAVGFSIGTMTPGQIVTVVYKVTVIS